MTTDLSVHLHCFSWNDAAMLPHFFRRFDGWVEQYHFWDHGSNDGTAELLAAHPHVTVHHYDAEGGSLIETQRRLFDEAWQCSRGKADWVILLHADEHLHHPDLPAYLRRCMATGVTAIKSIGYEMVGTAAPAQLGDTTVLADQVWQGCRSPGLDRLTMFSPSALTATNYSPGQHQAWPEGHVVWPPSAEVLLLRYQLLDDSYYLDKMRARAAALQPRDREHGWAAHLSWSEAELRDLAAELRRQARTVPGLGELADVDPRSYRGEEQIVEDSGLFDVDWYERQYPDVPARQYGAVTHYCQYGWQEGRLPSPYFDTRWYVRNQAGQLPEGRNPLVHYIEQGEQENLRPSRHFDTRWYRKTHGLDGAVSPLGHFMLHRLRGEVSPVPDFDPRAYVLEHPSLAGGKVDLYLHMVAHEDALIEEAEAEGEPVATEPPPAWDDVLVALGCQPDAATPPVLTVETLAEAVKPFLRLLPFDADAYLEANPDVAEAIATGVITSAHEHYVEHGYFEGRARTSDDEAATDTDEAQLP